MTGQVIGRADARLWIIQVDADYEFHKNEPVRIRTRRNAQRWRDLQGLYRCLVDFIRHRVDRLPGPDRAFIRSTGLPLLEAVPELLKLRTGTIVKRSWIGPDGIRREAYELRSTADMDYADLIAYYDAARDYSSRFIDLTAYEKEHQKAREILGKE